MDYPTYAELIGEDTALCRTCNGTGHVENEYGWMDPCPGCDGMGRTLASRLVRLLWSDDIQARVAAGDWAAIELVKVARDVRDSHTPCEHLIDVPCGGCSPICRAGTLWADIELPEDL